MKILKLLYVLYKIRLLNLRALLRLALAVFTHGVNLMALLNFAARAYGKQVALVDDRETLTYRQLFEQAEKLASALQENHRLEAGQKVGFLCKNHATLVKAIYAVSSTGADIYLLNAEMSGSQFDHIVDQQAFDLLIYDEECSSLLKSSTYSKASLVSDYDTLSACDVIGSRKPRRTSSGKLVLLTGGTTGAAKTTAHKPSLFNYLDPFHTFLTRLNILKYQTAYIATPIYHGYGVAVLLLFCAVGKKAVIQRGFHAEKACRLIREHQVEVVTVVPLMLSKMLQASAESLKSLRCIASGGAELSPKLVRETQTRLGDVLYNLYGTSEAGLNMIATPEDLTRSPRTIGRKIRGAQLKIVNAQKLVVRTGEIGQLCIRNSWSMKTGVPLWLETGDLGYRDEQDLYFLCGRVDSMIVSAGENVYPLEVEQVILTHPLIEDAAVIGVRDESFGQRLKAFVRAAPQEEIAEEELREWLRSRLARYQLPRDICFVDQLPYTPLGKLDRKQLK
jgi:fatty-acyl-CoA synthase